MHKDEEAVHNTEDTVPKTLHKTGDIMQRFGETVQENALVGDTNCKNLTYSLPT